VLLRATLGGSRWHTTGSDYLDSIVVPFIEHASTLTSSLELNIHASGQVSILSRAYVWTTALPTIFSSFQNAATVALSARSVGQLTSFLLDSLQKSTAQSMPALLPHVLLVTDSISC
jgi:hypothetical protein